MSKPIGDLTQAAIDATTLHQQQMGQEPVSAVLLNKAVAPLEKDMLSPLAESVKAITAVTTSVQEANKKTLPPATPPPEQQRKR
jgi:hypothetical protein